MSQPDTPRAHTGPAGASRTDPTDPSSALVTDRADGRWAAHTSVDTESVVHHARACIAAAGQAAEVLRPLVGSDASARDADALHACDDEVDVLRAVAALCARPPAASRAAVLRKTLEAGLTASVECAAACEGLGDTHPDVAACATAHLRCRDGIREALRRLNDPELRESSGAT